MSRNLKTARSVRTRLGLSAEPLERRAMLTVAPMELPSIQIFSDDCDEAEYNVVSVPGQIDLSVFGGHQGLTSNTTPSVIDALPDVGLTPIASGLLGQDAPGLIEMPSWEFLEQSRLQGLQDIYSTVPEYMEPPISEAMMQDIYMDMFLGSVVHNADGMTGGEIGMEVASNTAEEVGGWALGAYLSSALGSLFGVATQVSDYSETGAKGVTAVCEHREKLNDQFEQIDGMEGDTFEDCEEMAGNEDEPKDPEGDDPKEENPENPQNQGGEEPEDEPEDCFPPIILEEIANLVEPLVHTDGLMGREVFGALAKPLYEVQQSQVEQQLVGASIMSTHTAQQQAFALWH